MNLKLSRLLYLFSIFQFFNGAMDIYVWLRYQYLVPSWAMALEILGSSILIAILGKVLK